MLVGTQPLEELISNIPCIESFDADPQELSQVEILQVQYELSASQIQTLLPPALDATLPPLGQWTIWSAPESPWGSFCLSQFRVSCRSGARPRGLLLAATIDNPTAQEALAAQWGLSSQLAETKFERAYESASLLIQVQDRPVLDLQALDPEPLNSTDVQFFASMHAAQTPNGLRLVQFDPSYETNRVERYTPKINSIDAGFWNCQSAQPVYPVIGYGLSATVHLPKLRFVCKPDVSAFQGTEVIGA